MKSRFRFTPSYIEDLHPNEVFVFGSNSAGNHYGGAANLAFHRFGAVWGVGEGLRGNSYALPTLNAKMKPISVQALSVHFKFLFREIDANPQMIFLLTKVGCGIAGFSIKSVANAFWSAVKTFYEGRWTDCVGSLPENLVIPEEFYDYMPKPYRDNADFNGANSDLLFVNKQIERVTEKVQTAKDPEEYEHLQDELRELESQRNSVQEYIRDFIQRIANSNSEKSQ